MAHVHLRGFGGSADLRGPRLIADYQPGVFELTELFGASVAIAVTLGAVATGCALGAAFGPAVGLACHAAGAASLLCGAVSWFRALRGIAARGPRRVQLSRGWVEVGDEIRHLRDAALLVEPAGFGLTPIAARLTLRFGDGARVPLIQGPWDRVEPFARALRTAPARRA